MNKERILRLASRLDKVQTEHFNIDRWYQKNGNKPKEVAMKRGQIVVLNEGFCGSAACVLGHAALIKDFNKEGLYVTIDPYGDTGRVVYYKDDNYQGSGFTAGSLFFDIPEEDAAVLFGAVERGRYWEKLYNKTDGKIDPKDVAAALRAYVETEGGNLREIRATVDAGKY